jgi:hypothetical protein
MINLLFILMDLQLIFLISLIIPVKMDKLRLMMELYTLLYFILFFSIDSHLFIL